jgi:nucleotide-binding universal stress UspA family protein
MNALTVNQEQTAGTRAGSPDGPVYAVVGFDGSASSLRALDTAARLLNDRPGGMEIVYVAHPGSAQALGQQFDDTTRELSRQVRAHLQASHRRAAAQRWHFQRRDGAIADNLVAVADDLHDRHGTDAEVFLVVGRSEHGYHHGLGSVPAALERHVHYPVIVIP